MGEELTPGGRHMANTWQGEFPRENLASDGHERTSRVECVAAQGLHPRLDCTKGQYPRGNHPTMLWALEAAVTAGGRLRSIAGFSP